MTPSKIIETSHMYKDCFGVGTRKPRRFTLDREPDDEERMSHLLWMAFEIENLVNEGRTEKAFRWLGFLQGALWTMDICTIPMLKDDNRPK